MTAVCVQARGFLVTPDEAAELVGTSRGAIDVMAWRGYLERVRVGRRVWFWSDDVYDAHAESGPTRDQWGRFAPRISPL